MKSKGYTEAIHKEQIGLVVDLPTSLSADEEEVEDSILRSQTASLISWLYAGSITSQRCLHIVHKAPKPRFFSCNLRVILRKDDATPKDSTAKDSQLQ
jgi:hypothetical protein